MCIRDRARIYNRRSRAYRRNKRSNAPSRMARPVYSHNKSPGWALSNNRNPIPLTPASMSATRCGNNCCCIRLFPHVCPNAQLLRHSSRHAYRTQDSSIHPVNARCGNRTMTGVTVVLGFAFGTGRERLIRVVAVFAPARTPRDRCQEGKVGG